MGEKKHRTARKNAVQAAKKVMPKVMLDEYSKGMRKVILRLWIERFVFCLIVVAGTIAHFRC